MAFNSTVLWFSNSVNCSKVIALLQMEAKLPAPKLGGCSAVLSARQPLSLGATAVSWVHGSMPQAAHSRAYLHKEHSGPQSLPVVQQHVANNAYKPGSSKCTSRLAARCCDSCSTRSARCTLTPGRKAFVHGEHQHAVSAL